MAGKTTKPSPLAFNADERAERREAATITIGGVEYRRRRKNHKVTRELGALMRGQERHAAAANRLRARLADLPDDAPVADVEKIGADIDAETAKLDDLAYDMIALLLVGPGGKAPVVGHLMESLDVEDVGELVQSLTGGGEPVEGPTLTPASSA